MAWNSSTWWSLTWPYSLALHLSRTCVLNRKQNLSLEKPIILSCWGCRYPSIELSSQAVRELPFKEEKNSRDFEKLGLITNDGLAITIHVPFSLQFILERRMFNIGVLQWRDFATLNTTFFWKPRQQSMCDWNWWAQIFCSQRKHFEKIDTARLMKLCTKSGGDGFPAALSSKLKSESSRFTMSQRFCTFTSSPSSVKSNSSSGAIVVFERCFNSSGFGNK